VTVGLVIVSHSAKLAEGVVEVAGQMAAGVPLRAAGGTGDGGIGTSFDAVLAAITGLLAGGHEVVVLTDLGSATMTAQAAREMFDADAPVRVADAPLVEGAVAAAVAARIGRGLDAVVRAAEDAARAPDVRGPAPSSALTRVLTLVNDVGLHARPAARLANLAAEFDATITVDGADATSVLSLMSLDLGRGAQFELAAEGPQAAMALDAMERLVTSGFTIG